VTCYGKRGKLSKKKRDEEPGEKKKARGHDFFKTPIGQGGQGKESGVDCQKKSRFRNLFIEKEGGSGWK